MLFVVVQNGFIKLHETSTSTTYYDAGQYGGSSAPALPDLKTVQATVYDVTLPYQSNTEVRRKKYEYYTDTGSLKHETIEPGTSFALKTTYTYSTRGQLGTTTVSGGSGDSSIVPRVSENVYETSYPYRLKTKKMRLTMKRAITMNILLFHGW